MAGDHFLVPPRKVPCRKMYGVREFQHLPKEVRACAEAFDDPGDLSPSRTCPPQIVSRSHLACSFSIFDDRDLCAATWGSRGPYARSFLRRLGFQIPSGTSLGAFLSWNRFCLRLFLLHETAVVRWLSGNSKSNHHNCMYHINQ